MPIKRLLDAPMEVDSRRNADENFASALMLLDGAFTKGDLALTAPEVATIQAILGTGGGGGVTTGIKNHINVVNALTDWQLVNGAVSLAKLANLATATLIGRNTAGTGVPEALSATTVRTLLNVANGATANSADATLLARANHTGTQTAATISDFNEAIQDMLSTFLVAGSNVTLTYNDAGNTLTIAAAGAGGVADGDKGSITVSAGGTVWTIDASAVANSMLAAGIDALKIADGSVSNAEFQYLNGVTSAIQTQIAAKLDAALATAITDTKATFTNADQKIILDAAAGGAAKLINGAVERTYPVGTGLGTTGAVNLDMAALPGSVQTIAMTGNITFTASNYAAGRNAQLRLDANGGARTLAWPATWKAYGAALPTTLASGKILRVSIESTGTTEAAVDVTSALLV